jgi:thiamine-monophosphate kinase
LVGELGERKIIEIILGCLDQMPNMPIPFGDDVSAVDIGNEKLAVIKTDMLVGKTDVPPGMNLWQAARKAVVMNISDLAAKGVKPYALLASIGIPGTFTEKDVHQIGEGLNAGAREYNTYVLGGDTNEASDLVISCTAFGIVEKHFLMKRNGAKPNDLLAVTGFFGKSSSGLQILLEALKAPVHIKEKLVNTVLMPKARLKEGLALAQTQAVTASIDSSDGLAWSLHEISRASNVGFVIDNLPIAYEVEEFAGFSSLNPIELSLYGGEEYELVVAIKPKRWEKAKEATEHVGTPLIKIGQITKEKSFLLRMKEKTIHVKPKGWEHLRTT